MEKGPPAAPPSTTTLKHLSYQEWETLIDDFRNGGSRREKWTSAAASLLDLALSNLLRKDVPLSLKLHILIFLEEHSSFIFQSQSPNPKQQQLIRLVDTLRSLIQAPNDAVSTASVAHSYSLKEQAMASVTSIFITSLYTDAIDIDRMDTEGEEEERITVKLDLELAKPLEKLIELLLIVINRPNHSPDRQTRGVACECLRELERAFPTLLSEIGGHLWNLCQSERTHAAQSYLLLLATLLNTSTYAYAALNTTSYSSILNLNNTSSTLVPFNLPQWLVISAAADGSINSSVCTSTSTTSGGRLISGSDYMEMRRVMAFLLEWGPQYLTPCGLVEFISLILPVAALLELQLSLLKVQFSGLLYTYDPLLCHAFLGMYLHFLDSFGGQDKEVGRRLVLIAREVQHHLVFRLLALHWLQGFFRLILSRDGEKKNAVLEMELSYYPTVFDPLAVKALKLDLLAYCSILMETNAGKATPSDANSLVKLFEDGLVSVSAFKWLPPWSSETAVAFRSFHKFLIGASSHSDPGADSSTKILLKSAIFRSLQKMLVDLAMEFQGLVPVIVAFIDRWLQCFKHRWLGERVLQTFDEYLLPKLSADYRLGSCFQIFERIAENETIPPSRLLELLIRFMLMLVERHGPDTGLKSWSLGSKILGICRNMMMHHPSSRLFQGLSRLLAFTCLCFPDLEVRDIARIYLRMLVCVPGKKLRNILKTGEQLPGISPSSHSSSFFNAQSAQSLHDIKKSNKNILSYIQLEREVPLLVKQSWSLSLLTLGIEYNKPGYLEAIRDIEPPSQSMDPENSNTQKDVSQLEKIDKPEVPLRVMDSKIAEIVGTLRRHFSTIPDFRHMPGLKIRIPCTLRFKSQPINHICGVEKSANHLDRVDELTSIYATVVTFSSSAPYGSIPSYHIPFLLGEPPETDFSAGQISSLDIIPVENGSGEEESFKALVKIELEPREPVPGLVDVFIETNAANGQIIRGQLQSISVGIEDMFLRAAIPENIPEGAVSVYYVDLFHALWEACGSSSSTGRETFQLKGSKGVAAIYGTQSVKLLEVPATSLIQAVERYLAPFVVCVVGEPLVNVVKDAGMIRGVVWKGVPSDSHLDGTTSESTFLKGPLYLKFAEDEDERSQVQVSKKNMGSFHILIFLPPRFHLLFQMEVHEVSTLVRIRTDHWPCLAYIDDYLEALFSA